MFNIKGSNTASLEKTAKANRKDPVVEGKVAVIGHAVDRIVTVTGRAVITYFVVEAVRQVMTSKTKK